MLYFLLAFAADLPQPLNLTCFGQGTTTEEDVSVTNGSAYGSGMVGTTPYSGNANATSTVTTSHDRTFTDQVDIRLFAGDDRIRLPRTMLPALHGGKDGWFKLKNVAADERTIKAKASVNPINNPDVFIDRTTGTISISGRMGDYTGRCERVDAAAPAKF